MENQYYKQRINSVIDYIEENLDTKFSLDDLAKVATFSKYHFQRIFKAVTGETLNGYIKRLKMEKIYRLLCSHKDKSLTEIALDMGYSSSANFSRDVFNYYHLSPSKIRTLQSCPISRKILSIPNLNISYQGIENIPDKPVIYNRVSNGYHPEIINKEFTRLLYFFRDQEFPLVVKQIIGIGHDDPDYTPPEKCRYDACIAVDNIFNRQDIYPFNYKVLKGGKYAVFLFEGKAREFSPAWDLIFREWVVNSEYIPQNRPHLEMYLPCKRYKERFFRAHLCLPVKKIKH